MEHSDESKIVLQSTIKIKQPSTQQLSQENDVLETFDRKKTWRQPVNVRVGVERKIEVDDVGDELEVDASSDPGLLVLVSLAPLLVLVDLLRLLGFESLRLILVQKLLV